MPVSFSVKFQVANWKETRVQMLSLVEHVRTAASDILSQIHIEKIQFSPAFWYSFILNLF